METITEKDFSSQNLEHFHINKYVLLLTIIQQKLKAFTLTVANASHLVFPLHKGSVLECCMLLFGINIGEKMGSLREQ